MLDKQQVSGRVSSGWVDLREGIVDLFDEAQDIVRDDARFIRARIRAYRALFNRKGFNPGFTGTSTMPRRCLTCSNPVVGGKLGYAQDPRWWYCKAHRRAKARRAYSCYKITPLPRPEPRPQEIRVKSELGKKIKEARLRLGISQEKMAGVLGIKNRSNLSELESGYWNPSTERGKEISGRLERFLAEQGDSCPLKAVGWP